MKTWSMPPSAIRILTALVIIYAQAFSLAPWAHAQAGGLTSQIAFSASQNPSIFGKFETFSIAVTGTGPTPTGAVQLEDGSNPLGPQITLNADGTASYTVATLSAGQHAITANYSGDGNYASAQSALTVSVNPVPASETVWTQHNDNNRSGADLTETTLTTSNVNSSQFGRIFARQVDGQIYAQPLYVPNLNIAGGIHNVVLCATENDSVYAFDADDPTASAPLWQDSFIDPAAGVTTPLWGVDVSGNISPQIGITSTPVIDLSDNVMYVVAFTKEVSGSTVNYVQRLHALDITTGAEVFGGPVVISCSVPGAAADSVNGVVTFNPQVQNQRAGLLLANGQVFICWASFGDEGAYHGWVMSYSASTLAQTGVFCDSPNGMLGGIWQAGQGPVVDSSGNIYFMTGNGTSDAQIGGPDYGDCVLKLSPSTGTSGINPFALSVADWFMPSNEDFLNDNDQDMCSGGLLEIAGTNWVLGGGKQGVIYLMNTAAPLTNFNPLADQVTQEFQATLPPAGVPGEIHGSPVFWQGPSQASIYVWGENDVCRQYGITFGGSPGAAIGTTALSTSAMVAPLVNALPAPYSGYGSPGGFLAVSSNGTQPGTGILWASTPYGGNAEAESVPGALRAFDATNLANELWDSKQAGGRDDGDLFAKFCVPTVANGKVYMASFSGELNVYGLLPPAQPSPTNLTAYAGNGQVALYWTGTSSATAYAVLRGVKTGGPYDIVSTTFQTSFVDGSVNPGTAYYYVVVAVSPGGWSGLSAEAAATPLAWPPAPANVSAQGLVNQILMNWTASAGATSYLVGRSPVSGGPYTQVASIPAGSLSALGYLDSTVLAGTPYYYVVIAHNAPYSVNSALSAEVSATPLASKGPAPGTPTAVIAAAGPGVITVAWTGSGSATSYLIKRSTLSGGACAVLASVPTSQPTMYSDTAVTAGSTYYYVVVAFNSANSTSSPPSAQASAVAALPVPAIPANVSAIAGLQQITVFWNASAGATSYMIERGAKSGGPYAVISTSTPTTASAYSYTDQGRTPGKPCYYVIVAVNAACQTSSAPSAEVSAAATAPIISVPQNATALGGAGQINVSWTGSPNATSYQLMRSATSAGGYSLIASVPLASSNAYAYTDTGRIVGKTYYYEVTAVDATDLTSSAPSAPVSAAAYAPVPGVPTNVSAVAGSSAQITIAWTGSVNATGYQLERSATAVGGYSVVATIPSTSATTYSYSDSGRLVGKTYYYYVVATNSTYGTSSGQSSTVSAVPTAPVPAVPGGFTAVPGAKQVTLSWNASSNATEYELERSATAVGGYSVVTMITGTSVTSYSYTDTGRITGKTYYYEVIALNTTYGTTSGPSSPISAVPL